MGAIYGNSYYTIVDGPKWDQAEKNANDMGGHLVAFSSRDEESFVINYVESINRQPWWCMGLEYSPSDSKMEWKNGESYEYTNWYSQSGISYPNISIQDGYYKYTEFTADPAETNASSTCDNESGSKSISAMTSMHPLPSS